MDIRRWVACAALPLLLALAGCGHSAAPPAPAAAAVQGTRISRATLNQYTVYAARYFSSALGTASGRCPSCRTMQPQVLRRLLQELVIRRYAATHHIVLSAGQQHTIDITLHRLTQPGTVTAALLHRHVIGRTFLRTLLVNEALVRAVEARVTAGVDATRYAFHLRTITVPIAPGGHGVHAYHHALDLATEGGKPPHRAIVETSWVRPRRLAGNIRRAARAASPGQYIGPYRTSIGYIVIQVLAHGPHRAGKAVRQRTETRSFQQWLDRQVRAAHPICYANAGKTVPCPGPQNEGNMNAS